MYLGVYEASEAHTSKVYLSTYIDLAYQCPSTSLQCLAVTYRGDNGAGEEEALPEGPVGFTRHVLGGRDTAIVGLDDVHYQLL